MNSKELKKWIFEKSLEDQWLLKIDTVQEDEALTLAQVEEGLRNAEYFEVQILHVSQQGLQPSPWVDYDAEVKQEPKETTPVKAQTPKPTHKLCPCCKHKLKLDAAKCERCGEILAPTHAPPKTPVKQQKTATPTSKPKSGSKDTVIVLIALTILGLLYFLYSSAVQTLSEEQIAENNAKAVERSPSSGSSSSTDNKRAKRIPGISAADLKLNLQDRGFTVDKSFVDGGMVWTCNDYTSRDPIFKVVIRGRSAYEITSVKASIATNSTALEKVASIFLGYIASLPYDGSDPSGSKFWVETKISNGGTKTHSGVKFELDASKSGVRELTITPAE